MRLDTTLLTSTSRLAILLSITRTRDLTTLKTSKRSLKYMRYALDLSSTTLLTLATKLSILNGRILTLGSSLILEKTSLRSLADITLILTTSSRGIITNFGVGVVRCWGLLATVPRPNSKS